MFLKLLKEETLKTLRDKIYSNKEILFFVLDVLSQTFEVYSFNNLNKPSYEKYLEIKKEIKAYYENLIINLCNNQDTKEDLYIKLFTNLFKLYNTSDSITSLSKDEFNSILSTMDYFLKNSHFIKNPDLFNKAHMIILDLLIISTEKTGVYLEEQKKIHNDYCTREAQTCLRFTEENIRFMINICLVPYIRKDQRFWNKLQKFCSNWPAKQMLVLFLKIEIAEATSNLVDNLSSMSESEYSTISDPKLNPFEGLQMNKSYSLQVLYNAYNFLITQNSEDPQSIINNSKYKELYQTNIYQCFDIWINLFKLIQIPAGYKHKQTLVDYIKTIHATINDIVAFEKKAKMRQGQELSSEANTAPPNATIFVRILIFFIFLIGFIWVLFIWILPTYYS